ncbi:MAG: hypothetical protein J6K72_08330 [Clostridia bacterium]|nr:hypothetical protein [Clostridia bacterium]
MDIMLQLLSAGVIAALVTGVFSLIIAAKNNKRLIELENNKQEFTVAQERFKGLRDAYNELVRMLPEEELLGHFIMNLPSKADFHETGLSDAYEIAERNIKILFSHFQRYCYLLSDDQQKDVSALIGQIDDVTKCIVDVASGLQTYSTAENKASNEPLNILIRERIVKAAEFEEMYHNLYKHNLSKLSNSK